MSNIMFLTVIEDDRDPKPEPGEWDFSDPGQSYFMWFMWWANDPPYEIRIVVKDSQELLDAVQGFFSHRPYVEKQPDGKDILYQLGDKILGLDTENLRIRVYISPTLAEPPEVL